MIPFGLCVGKVWCEEVQGTMFMYHWCNIFVQDGSEPVLPLILKVAICGLCYTWLGCWGALGWAELKFMAAMYVRPISWDFRNSSLMGNNSIGSFETKQSSLLMPWYSRGWCVRLRS